jgi:hypothetical protein
VGRVGPSYRQFSSYPARPLDPVAVTMPGKDLSVARAACVPGSLGKLGPLLANPANWQYMYGLMAGAIGGIYGIGGATHGPK